MLRLLASLGVLTEDDQRGFGLTLLGERLRTGVPASMRAWAMLVESLGGVRAFEPIIETVRTGKPGVDIAHGMNIFEFVATRPELARGFQAAMSERTAAFAPSVAAGYDFSPDADRGRHRRRQGHAAGGHLAGTAGLRGVLFDRASSGRRRCGGAAGRRRRGPLRDHSGDFFDGVPDGADGYILANVLHDWDDARAVQILAACRHAMATDGRVLIVERLIPDDPADAVPVLFSDLNMLVFTGGQERTNAEYGDLLAAAGLSLAKVQPVAAPYGSSRGTQPEPNTASLPVITRRLTSSARIEAGAVTLRSPPRTAA